MIRASAPGKLIISGEYAVLDGAPCLVVAIDRRAICQLETCDHWQFSSCGYSAQTSSFTKTAYESEPDKGDAGQLAWHSYQALAETSEPAKLHTNTEAFYAQRTKYGFGSSAAMSVAISGALAHSSNQKPDFATALKAHKSFQGGQGSGADVAAAFYGGCLHYQAQQAKPHALPDALHWMCVWTGSSSNTQAHINRFDDWLVKGNLTSFDNLKSASEHLTTANNFLSALKEYVECLAEFDSIAQLNIYTDAHRKLSDLAASLNVVYKPSGAGGGDLGLFVSEDPEHMNNFSQQAAQLGFQPLSMPITDQGLQIEL